MTQSMKFKNECHPAFCIEYRSLIHIASKLMQIFCCKIEENKRLSYTHCTCGEIWKTAIQKIRQKHLTIHRRNIYIYICIYSVCIYIYIYKHQFSSVAQSCLFVTPWTTVHQTSLSITNSWSLLKLMTIRLVMPSNQFILCHPLLLIYIHMYVYICWGEEWTLADWRQKKRMKK